MHITSSSREIIKVLRAGLTEGGLVLLLFSLISCADYSQEKSLPEIEVHKAALTLRPEKGQWFYQGAAYSGYAISFHADSSLAEKVGYYQGRKEGLAQRWYSDGTLKYAATFIANRLNGKVQAWSRKGVLVKEANFVEGAMHGTQRFWYDSGKPFKETHYNMGVEEGLQKGWLESGALFANYEAKNGRFFGLKRANACYELKDEVVQF